MRLGNYGKVLAMFEEVDHDVPKWKVLAGECYMNLEKYLKAKECFEESLMSEKSPEVYISLFKILDLIGHPLEQLAKESLVAFPKNIQILLMLGLWHVDSHRTEKAFSCYSQVLQLDPTNRDAIFGFGSLLNQAGNFKRALWIYSVLEPTSMDPIQANNVACALYGNSLQTNHDMLERAISFLELALKESPIDWRLMHNLGLCLLANRQYPTAAKFLASSYSFQELQLASPETTTLLFLAVSLGKCGDQKAARFAFEKAVELDRFAHSRFTLSSSAFNLFNFIVFLINAGGEQDMKLARERFAVLREYGEEELKSQLGDHHGEYINRIFIQL